MKKILVLSFTYLQRDARVRRQVDMLKKNYQVTVACLDADETTAYTLIKLKTRKLTWLRKGVMAFFLLIRWYNKAHHVLHPYRYLAQTLQPQRFDLVIANDVESLPLAFEIADQQKSKVLFDAHEYAPRHFEDKPLWKFFFQPLNIYICKKFIPRVDSMITIGQGLATEYEKSFGVKAVVITNANVYFDLTPSPLSCTSIKLVHHGIATPSRKLEIMIEMMEYLDERFTLDMYLLSQGYSSKKTIDYPETLRQLAAKTNRVRILPPINSTDIVPTINQYDVGLFLIPPINFNYANTLPNKLFDFIQARLAIAIGPTPEMAEIVNRYKIGVVSEDFTAKSLADKLNEITHASLGSFKANTAQAALDLNAEKNEEIFNQIITQLLRHSGT